MSCYNGARWLPESIRSVLLQTHSDFEFLIVDDGSTDQSLEIVSAFSKNDTRIVSLPKSNSGLTDSLNFGISHARGRWIARLDADDIAEPDRLERQYEYVKKFPQTAIVGSGLVLIDKDGNKRGRYHYPSNHNQLVNHAKLGKSLPAHSSAFVSSDAIRAIGGYRSRFKRSQDLDLWLRLSEIGRIGCLSSPLVRLRKHSGQISQEAADAQLIDAYLAIVSYRLRQRGFPDPVEANDETFTSFRNWIGLKILKNARIQDKRRFDKCREDIRALPNGKNRRIAMLNLFLRNHHVVEYALYVKIFGSSLPGRITEEWISKQK